MLLSGAGAGAVAVAGSRNRSQSWSRLDWLHNTANNHHSFTLAYNSATLRPLEIGHSPTITTQVF